MLCVSRENWSVSAGDLFFMNTPTKYTPKLYKRIPSATLGKTVEKSSDFEDVDLVDHTKAAPEEFL